MSQQNVFILGATGSVGTELIRQIQEHDGVNHEHRNPTLIVGVANSTRFLLSSSGLTLPDISGTIMKAYFSSEEHTQPYQSHNDILEAVRKSGLEGDVVFIDVTADGERMTEFHRSIIQTSNNCMVTANKKPAASGMATFEAITSNPHRYRYNTTVMAGAGAVPYFQEAHGLSETIESVEGTFSGTLAYVCSELQKGEKLFSQIVKEAKEKGYTEPHPIDDLNGEDVKRKMLILLRSAGVRIEDAEVELRGFVDSSTYANMGTSEFMEAIKSEDIRIMQLVSDNIRVGLVPRYIASYKNIDGTMKASVGLDFVPLDSELGNLKGTANKVLLHTSQRTPIGSAPHIIQSPGAGVSKTAASVRADLLYLLNGTNLWAHN